MRTRPCVLQAVGIGVVITMLCTTSLAAHAEAVGQEQRWEHTLTSTGSYANPYTDVTVAVTFTHQGTGQTFSSYGFWDGGSTFRVRGAFPATGTWTWSTAASNAADTGLHNQSGSITVNPYIGDNALYQRGMLKVSDNNRYLTYGDGTPFNWTGDTAWNTSWFSTQSQWRDYVDHRAAQGFTVLQVHATRTKENFTNNGPLGVRPFDGTAQTPNAAYWQDLEAKIEYANQQGLAVMLVGAGYPQTNYYTNFTTQAAFARYIAGRLHGSHVIFSPSMDQDLSRETENDNVGEYLDDATSRHLITQHVNTSLTAAKGYHDKDYLDFTGFQSGHAGGNLTNAYGNARTWALDIYDEATTKPIINTEAMYDGRGDDSGAHFREKDARKLGWITRLSGAMGYTYGAGSKEPLVTNAKGGVWLFNNNSGDFDYWRTAMAWDSGEQVALMHAFFDQRSWWELGPAHGLIQNQAGGINAMVLAKTEAGDLAVAYLPDNASIVIDMTAFAAAMTGQWFNPVDGSIEGVSGVIDNTGDYTFLRPDGWEDAVLTLNAVPEPGSVGLLAAGVLGVMCGRRIAGSVT